MRDIFFQLAFAAYVGAFFNLNPFIERDGYHMLVDGCASRGCGGGRRSSSSAGCAARASASATRPVLARYSLCGLGWSVVTGAASRSAMTFRYKTIFLDVLVPAPVVYGVMGTLWLVFFLPVVFVLGKPLLAAVPRG